MIAPNSLKIIINKGKKKANFILFLSADQVVKMMMIFAIFYYVLKLFISELMAFSFGLGAIAFYAVLCYELPDHLSLSEHIKIAYNFYFKQTKNFLYYKELNTPVKEDITKHEFIQEERIKPTTKAKKANKKKKKH